jgi:hypothetical protein
LSVKAQGFLFLDEHTCTLRHFEGAIFALAHCEEPDAKESFSVNG